MSWTEFVNFFVYLWKVLNLLEPFGKGRNFNLTEVKLDEKCNFDFCRKNYGSDTDTEIQPRFSVAHYKKCCQILEIFFVLFLHSTNIPWKILDRSCNHSTVVIEKKNIFGIFWGFNGYFSVISIDQIQDGLGEVFAHQGQPGDVGMYRSQTILHRLKRNYD